MTEILGEKFKKSGTDGMEDQLAELEEILLWYVEKYGLSDRAREYFANKSHN